MALVDEADLSNEIKEHLAACPRCRGNKKQVEQDMARLGRIAEHLAPSPTKQVILPAKESRIPFRWNRNFQSSFGMAVVACLILMIVWWQGGTMDLQNDRQGKATRELMDAERLMTEISMLVENPLPRAYQDISDISRLSLEEDFMQFIVPDIEEEGSA